MHEQKLYYVYIMASRSRTLYIGITSKPEQRIAEHKSHIIQVSQANTIANGLYSSRGMLIPVLRSPREKQLKRWLRAKKIALIERVNPAWVDLSERWGKPLA